MEEELKGWMDQFVRVRLIQCNSIDLNLFHFDYDLTFAAFFMNADKTLYGRYGTRSSMEAAEKDISIVGFAKAMKQALALHRAFPGNKASLLGKTAPFSEFDIPQQYPQLEGRFQPWLNFEGNVAASCIHCHMVGEAERRLRRSSGTQISDKTIYPWPMPDVLGFSLDPEEVATVRSVEPDTAAAAAGMKSGDQILTMSGQPIISIADVQWVLHQAKEPSTVPVQIRRGLGSLELDLRIDKGWRRRSDIGWRVTSWDLRRMATGGLKMRNMTPEERKTHRIAENRLALLVEHVGQYGDHGVAKRAGFLKGDILVEFDGMNAPMRETEIFAHVLRHRPIGSEVRAKVLRQGKAMQFKFKLQ